MTEKRLSRSAWCLALLLAALICGSFATVGASVPEASDPVSATRHEIESYLRSIRDALAEIREIDAARKAGQPYTRKIEDGRRILDRKIQQFRKRHQMPRGRDDKGKVTGGTVAAAMVEIKGVRRGPFAEGSPRSKGKPGETVRNNPRYQSPQEYGSTQNHGEQNLLGDLADKIDEAYGVGSEVEGRVHIQVEQPPCSPCRQGGGNPEVDLGVIPQFSAEFPNLRVVVTNARNSEVIVLLDGVAIERFPSPRGSRRPVTRARPQIPSFDAMRAENRRGMQALDDAGLFGASGLDPAGGSVDAPGGVDFSTLELRYMSDVSSDKTRAMGYAFKAPAADGKRRGSGGSGLRAARRASDAFFVWLALPPRAMWVNLNPSEPDRIIDSRFGRTNAGRVLLEADLRMKKTAARLTNPNTRLGRRYWSELEAVTSGMGACSASRMWIVPARATVRATTDELYILKAPLTVKLESKPFADLGARCGASSLYAKQIEAVFRRLILPRVQRAVSRAPQFAALRSVYMSRVAAEWYRHRRKRRDSAFADIIGSGDISRWASERRWTPRKTFRNYVRSYKDGEYKASRRTRRGAYTVKATYQLGGVDFGVVPRQNVSSRQMQMWRPGLPGRISQALTRPTADPQNREVWLAGASFDRAAAAKHPAFQPPGSGDGGLQLRAPIVALLAFSSIALLAYLTRLRMPGPGRRWLGRTHDPHAAERSQLQAAIGAADHQISALDGQAARLVRELGRGTAVRDERDGLDRRTAAVEHELQTLRDELVEQQIARPPAWARAMFGERPAQYHRARHYDRGVREAARYRIEHAIGEQTPDLGPEPASGRARSAWRGASRLAQQTQRRLGRDVKRERDGGRKR